jgi:hypothetical protein
LARERFKVASIIEPANISAAEDDDMLSLLGFIRNQCHERRIQAGRLVARTRRVLFNDFPRSSGIGFILKPWSDCTTRPNESSGMTMTAM